MRPEDVGLVSWSVDRHDAARALHVAAQELSVSVIQLGFFTEDAVRRASAAELRTLAESLGVRIAATFAAFEQEDYSSIAKIAETGGYLPDGAWERRRAFTLRVADLTVELGATMLAVHLGTIPSDRQSAAREALLSRARQVADALVERGLALLLETGRESAETLTDFLADLHHDQVAVNFDPANFVVYGTDDPISALGRLKNHVRLVHIKDGVRSARPGVDFGKPAPPGSGDANIPRLVSKLRLAGYTSPLLLEYGGGGADAATISAGIEYLRTMLA